MKKILSAEEIRTRFLEFFKNREHKIIPSASLIAQSGSLGDKSINKTLFTTAGMQPLVPYLLGEEHPKGKRLVNIQKCLRIDDIEEVGDSTHLTFFEMLGNWSLGDYFKEDAIKWSYELLTSKDEGFDLDPKKLYVTVFAGDEKAPRDNESVEIWKKYIPEHRIYYLPAEKNWWSPGDNGPSGPDTEMFYDVTKDGLGDLSFEAFLKADANQRVIEIWNDVFMQYEQKGREVIGKLKNKNVDTGAGFERLVAVLQGKDNVFDTDLFSLILDRIPGLIPQINLRSRRIVADHIKAVTMVIADGVIPSSGDKYGNVPYRLLRDIILNHIKAYRIPEIKYKEIISILVSLVIKIYNKFYPDLISKEKWILEKVGDAIDKIKYADQEAIKKARAKGEGISGFDIFEIRGATGSTFSSILGSVGPVDHVRESKIRAEYEAAEQKHREDSRAAGAKKFTGGLADTSEMSVKYHTATHLLNAALRQILGKEVMQKGSNITPERLRFDFTFPRKLTDEEKKQIENLVNEKIKEDLPVSYAEMPKEEAEKTGAIHAFGEKYGDLVKVYSIGNEKRGFFSREFCGGPHVEHTGVLGHFKITKEEAVSAGVRRIKAVLE
jgi:alanyl-tRNA synthetase